MDETLTRVTIDVSNRPYLIWKVKLKVEKLGEMDTELFKEWFQAFSQAAGITLHIENIYGDNSHHIIESCFKGLARSLREAIEIDKRIKNKVPSTKGVLKLKMSIAVIDYGSGNLKSAAKALEAAANNINLDSKIIVTSDPEIIKKSNKVILPGQGSFRDCYLGIKKISRFRRCFKRICLS